MDSTILERRLGKVDEKIDEVTRKLEEKEKERNDASFEGRTRLDKFIDALYARLDVLNADSTRLNVALAAAAPAPGKNTPLTLDASVLPQYATHNTPRSLSRPLVRRHDSSLVSNLVSNLVPNSRLRVRTGLVRPSCEEG